MNKEYFWQKTEKCAQCAFNDDPDACHWYGYRFWKELPLADDCWDFLYPWQWQKIQSMYGSYKLPVIHAKHREFCHQNHPNTPAGYKPPYYPNDPLAKEDDMYTW